MSDSEEMDDHKQWKLDSAERQQLLYTRFGDREWDEIPKWNVDQIRTKVSGYVFNKDYEHLLETEGKKEKSAVERAIVKLKNASGDGPFLLLGCFYVDILLKKERTACIIPVLKTKAPDGAGITLYESQSGRVYYGGYRTYLSKNKLPQCWMCCPEGGTYRSNSRGDGREGRVLLKYTESPSCRTIFPIVDIISLVGGGLCTAVLATSVFFPPLFAFEMATLAAGTGVIGTSIYGMSRGVYELCDRDRHEQSCRLSDSEAFRQWLNIILSGGSAITAGGSVLMKAAALGGTSIVVNSANRLRLATTIIRYLSVSVNGLGIIVIIIDLVIKFMRNDLQQTDLHKLVSLCLLISNIVITLEQAEHIILFIADQPQRMRNAFNMVRNTSTTVVKVIRENVPWAEILEIITGDVAMNILRHIGFERTANTISYIRNRIRTCLRNRDAASLVLALQDISQHCFVFFTEILSEVREACSKLEKWFNVALSETVVRFRQNFSNSSGALALEITDEVDCVLDEVELSDSSGRDDAARSVINLVNSVASRVDCSNDAEYVKITELVCDRLRSRCNTEFIVQRHDATASLLTEGKKRRLFGEILSRLEQSSGIKEIEESFRKERNDFLTVRKNLILCKPVYQTAKNSVHYFETSSKNSIFSQFVFDAACELLGTDDLFGEGREFYLHPFETIFCVTDGDKSLIFDYTMEKANGKVKGIVILDE